jgi:hypothetical protein
LRRRKPSSGAVWGGAAGHDVDAEEMGGGEWMVATESDC